MRTKKIETKDEGYCAGSRIILIRNRKLLLMHRLKYGKEYYVLPGGGIEPGETPEEAAIREAYEETSIKIAKLRLLWEYKDSWHEGYYFLAEKFSGKAKIGNGPEFKEQNKDNKYSIAWADKKKLKKILFYPEPLKKKVMALFSNAPE